MYRRWRLGVPLLMAVLLALLLSPAASARGLRSASNHRLGAAADGPAIVNAALSQTMAPTLVNTEVVPTSADLLTVPNTTGDYATAESGPFTFTVNPKHYMFYQIKFMNSGSTTWSSADGYLLSIVYTYTTFPLGKCNNLAPGNTCVWNFIERAGTYPSTSNMYYQMNHSGTLFGQAIQVYITVT